VPLGTPTGGLQSLKGGGRKAEFSPRKVCSCSASRETAYRAAPAPGFRDSGWRETEGGSGKLWGVGYNGFGWSSTVSGARVRFLDFAPTWLKPQNSDTRAYGFQLRCLQEEGGGRAADFTLEPGGLSVRENLLRLACGAVELWGLNESLSSSPLRPRWPLLSVMRQKVGKERSQGDCHPLG
jgi:hypothetical protein